MTARDLKGFFDRLPESSLDSEVRVNNAWSQIEDIESVQLGMDGFIFIVSENKNG